MDIDSTGSLQPVEKNEQTIENTADIVKNLPVTDGFPVGTVSETGGKTKKRDRKKADTPEDNLKPEKPIGRAFPRPIAILLRACMFIPAAVLLIVGIRMFSLTFGTKLLFVGSGVGKQSRYYLLYIIIGAALGAAAYFAGKKLILSVPKNSDMPSGQSDSASESAKGPADTGNTQNEPVALPEVPDKVTFPTERTAEIDTSPAQTANDTASEVSPAEAAKPAEKSETLPGKCPSCGANISDGAKFCSGCGARIN